MHRAMGGESVGCRGTEQAHAGLTRTGAPLIVIAVHIFGELVQRLLVDVALELDHRVEWHPVVVPSPGVELWFCRGAQVHITVAPDEPEQIPDLFLAFVIAAPIA